MLLTDMHANLKEFTIEESSTDVKAKRLAVANLGQN